MGEQLQADAPIVDLLRKPELTAEVTSQMIYGARAVALETSVETPSGWQQVQTADLYRGWVKTADVLVQARDADDAQRVGAVVASNFANVYASPSIKQRPLLQLAWESQVQLLTEANAEAHLAPFQLAPEERQRWAVVDLHIGGSAFVLKGDLLPSLPRLSLVQSLAAAERFLGVTYTWGGVSSFGFDCSGLVQMIFRQTGITLPRDAVLQARSPLLADAVDTEPEPGDVLFFASPGGAIDHVGVALGEGRFLHATTHEHPGVQISLLAEPYWQTRLVLRRRLR